MRRALAIALSTMALPAVAQADNPYHGTDLRTNPVTDKALIADHRADQGRDRAAKAAAEDQQVAIPAHLAAIAACESGGNPRAVGGGGQYRGLFQFSYETWAAVGGQGDPAAASVAEQVKRAEILYAQAGPGQWPICGQ